MVTLLVLNTLKRFKGLELPSFQSDCLVLNADGASVNTGIHKDLGAKIKEEGDWLQLVLFLTLHSR